MKRILYLFTAFLFVFGLTACQDEDITYTEPVEGDFVETRERYDNIFGEDLIPDQWEGYGIGDPFVLRYDGRYYLYASTKNHQIGVRAWVSDDLINWSVVDNGTNETGYVSEDPITVTAYAPEVIYWDGMFYMYTSPGGNGHFVLTSDSPTGPFTQATNNFGESIDGSVFIDDDEQMYFLRAFPSGIRMVEMSDPLTLESGTTLDNTYMGSWVEGPNILKRHGIYYLTYTGTNVISPGYRINYSTATEIGSRSSFTLGPSNPLMLSTDPAWQGLGHNSVVLGPNLDSYYMVYHNLNSAAGPNRSFNINQILFNGTEMRINGGLHDNIVPQLPDFVSNDGVANYTQAGDAMISDTATNKVFSAEFNFIGIDTKLILGYEDADNHSYIQLEAGKIALHKVSGGTDTEVASGTLVNAFDFSVLHTVRVFSDGNKVSVQFDNMTKIEQADVAIPAGKIGYIEDTSFSYSSFVNEAYGSSEQADPKTGWIGSNLYQAKDGDASLGLIGSVDTITSNRPTGTYEMTLKEGASASYVIDIHETGLYALFMNMPSESAGKRMLVQIDDGTPLVIDIPSSPTDEPYLRHLVTELEIPSGTHIITFYGVDEITYQAFHLAPSSYSTPQFEADLTSYLDQGVEYVTLWKLHDEGHYAIAGNRQVLYFGDETIRDVVVEVEMMFIGETASATAGILLRASDVALHSSENYDSLMGYYIGFNNFRAFLNKYNYSLSAYNLDVDAETRFESGTFYTVRVEMIGNELTVFVDDVEILSYYDNDLIASGRIGFYTEGAEVVYRNLKITTP